MPLTHLLSPPQVFTHSKTGRSVGFSTAEHVATDPATVMVDYNEFVASDWARKPLDECVTVATAVDWCEKAASVTEQLMTRPSFESDGIRWTAKDPIVGNLLEIGSTRCMGFEDYDGVLGDDVSIEQARKLQRDNTLRGTKTAYNKMKAKRDALQREGLSMDDIDTLVIERPGAAFAIACVYLLEKMAGERELVDFHFVNSASGLAAFGWHIDDHAEKDKGRPKRYIDRSVACQCSPGLTSMTVAGLAEVDYPGVGGFIHFPAWALHRTGKRGDGVAMWKLVGFFA